MSELVKPRGKMTPFAFYVFICMEQAKKKHPDKNLVFQMVEDVCLARWEKMSDFHKKRFVTMSELDEARFNKEMEKYKSQKEVIDKEKKAKKKEENLEKKAKEKQEKEEKKAREKAAKKEELERKKEEKKKKKKDPNAPKGAKNAYMFFLQEMRTKLLAENPSLSVPETGKECGRRWKEISPSQKSRYEEMAVKDKERFKTEMAEYEAEKEAGEAVTKPGPSKVQNSKQEESEESGESEESEEESD